MAFICGHCPNCWAGIDGAIDCGRAYIGIRRVTNGGIGGSEASLGAPDPRSGGGIGGSEASLGAPDPRSEASLGALELCSAATAAAGIGGW